MLLMYADPARTKSMPSEEVAAVKRKHDRLHRELPRFGQFLNGAGLVLPEGTTSLRYDKGGRALVRTGPLFEASPEHLTAYYVIDSEDAAAVAAFAERLLDDHVTAVEIRRIHNWA
jgi:hypothetical protein